MYATRTSVEFLHIFIAELNVYLYFRIFLLHHSRFHETNNKNSGKINSKHGTGYFPFNVHSLYYNIPIPCVKHNNNNANYLLAKETFRSFQLRQTIKHMAIKMNYLHKQNKYTNKTKAKKNPTFYCQFFMGV